MNLKEHFLAFCTEQALLPPAGQPLLLAVSGGVDSMVLVDLLLQTGATLSIAHCNFQLRGAESDGDEAFVEQFCKSRALSFFSIKFDTKKYATESKCSVQMAARTLRYDWFEKLRQEIGATAIATAHHLNDSVETVLLNMARGTGIAGLTGIAPSRGCIIRPLLFATKQDILDYAQAKEIAWREDGSNAHDDYARNFIRHHIVPQFEALQPSFLNNMAQTMALLRSQNQNYKALGAWAIPSIPGKNLGEKKYDKARVLELPDPKAWLFDQFGALGFTDEQMRQIAENKKADVQATPWRLVADDAYIYLIDNTLQEINAIETAVQEDDLLVTLHDGSRLGLITTQPNPPFPDGRMEILVDLERLIFPLKLRNWRAGDYFCPLGMGGQTQKLQDFFTNNKLSTLEKERVFLLENGDGQIIWILGYRPDDRFKITSQSNIGKKIFWQPNLTH